MDSTLFLKRYSANLRITAFIVLSLAMMTIDHQYSHLQKLRATLTVLVHPLQSAANLPATLGQWASETLASRAHLIKENLRLRDEQLILNAKIQKMEFLETENQRLKQLLSSVKTPNDQILIAELLAVDLQPLRHQILINKGQRAGVYDGQPLIGAQGIIGQIIHVGPFSSTALLLTDPMHAIPIQINRNGLRAIAKGTGHSRLIQIEHLPNSADIRPGDLIVSSGLGDRFPAGYPVGVVDSVSRVAGTPFAEVNVTPSAELDKNRAMLLVWRHNARPPSPPPGVLAEE